MIFKNVNYVDEEDQQKGIRKREEGSVGEGNNKFFIFLLFNSHNFHNRRPDGQYHKDKSNNINTANDKSNDCTDKLKQYNNI